MMLVQHAVMNHPLQKYIKKLLRLPPTLWFGQHICFQMEPPGKEAWESLQVEGLLCNIHHSTDMEIHYIHSGAPTCASSQSHRMPHW